MKYSNLKAFEKHLESAAPSHLSLVYVLISKDEFERKSARDKIVWHVFQPTSIRAENLYLFDAAAVNEQLILQELQAYSFFASTKVIVITQADKLSKPTQDSLRAYFLKPNKFVHLIVEAASLNRSTLFYKDAEKGGILFDVAEEKPWEREKRLQMWVAQQFCAEGKELSLQGCALLVKQLGADQATLQQEIEKLICYVGARKDITLADISLICGAIPQENGWQLGDAIFRQDASEALRIAKSMLAEGVALIALLRQIRSQFQTDYQVCCMLASGKTPEDISQAFPFMRGSVLNKHLHTAQSYGMQRFKAGLLAIDETELRAKNSAGDPDWLAERLLFKLAIK